MKILFCDPLSTQDLFNTFAGYLRDATVISQDTYELPYFSPFSNPIRYLVLLKRLIDFANSFDLIVCSGLSPIWFRWSRKPFIFYNYGADLDQLPVQGWSGKPKKANMMEYATRFLIKCASASALRKASVVVLVPYQVETARKLGLKRLHFLPMVVDTELFKPMDKEHDGLVMFHPSRQVWTDRTITDCKGNDKVFKAFARFVQIYKGEVMLLVIEKGWDLEASKLLIKELGIGSQVKWMSPVSRLELSKLYNKSDIVLDQFVGGGVLSLIPIEAMACGTSVVSYVKEYPVAFYGEMPPIISAQSEDDIFHAMLKLTDSSLRSHKGEEGREWVKKYCSPEVSIPKYIELFNKVAAQ